MPANPLTKKVGPLPMWGWVVIVVGGGIVIYGVSRNRKVNEPAPEPMANPTEVSSTLLGGLTGNLGLPPSGLYEDVYIATAEGGSYEGNAQDLLRALQLLGPSSSMVENPIHSSPNAPVVATPPPYDPSVSLPFYSPVGSYSPTTIGDTIYYQGVGGINLARSVDSGNEARIREHPEWYTPEQRAEYGIV